MIKKLLVANRGEIAARVFRTAHELGIATVAVFSDPDADLPYVALADEAVRLPGAAPADTYLRGDLIIAAARATDADAVHPGYGFLSENAGFARDCAAAGLTFVGPSPEAIAAMGSKTEAKALMAAAGVPTLPGITVGPDVDADVDWAAEAARIGFPVLVKAAYGGGGRGMRIVAEPEELAGAVASARREAASAFGDDTVFLERYVVDPRHVEVQIFGDVHGSVVALFERDCSIQRRHQKIVEECPSPVVDDALRGELSAAAVAAGKAIGYTGAGTVEFVMDETGAFWFLEVNTRLQVEHPVTELVTGLDLVALQLRIAEGAPLPAAVTEARIEGHAIEVRLYAEDVPAGFLPATGTLHRFHVPAGVRVDAGVADGSVVGPHYDPMLAKVIAHGSSRADAARRLRRALRGAQIHGVVTNRELLVAVLDDADFLAGRYVRLTPLVREEHVDPLRAAVAALAEAAARRGSLPSGWRNVPAHPQRVAYAVAGQEVAVAYRFRRDGLEVAVDGEPLSLALVSAAPDRVVLDVDGVRRAFAVHQTDTAVFVDDATGSSTLNRVPRFPDPNALAHAGSLLAPMPGSVVRVAAAVGARVTAGQPLVVLEAMKMEHTVAAPLDGVLTALHVQAGDQVESGQALAVVEEPG
jgi:acetyl/propionyl-CoA carboxylase alpha subunit